MSKELENNCIQVYESGNQKLRMFIFELVGPPRPEKQTLFGRRRAYNPNRLTKQQIIWQVSPHAPKILLQGPLEMHLTFYLPIPKHIKGKVREQMMNNIIKHAVRPDCSNLKYLVENSLKGIVYKDDSQIWRAVDEKRWGDPPRTVIKIMET